MKRRNGVVALGLAIIFMVFTIVIIFLVQNVSNNFYKTKLQVIETKSEQFTKAFLVSAANIWTEAAMDSQISPEKHFNLNPGDSAKYFTLILNKGQDTEERVVYELDSQAGLIYHTESGSETISIDINLTMTSDLPGFEDSQEKGLVLEMEN
jgi:uncharacterized membrane protein YhiD involved in acid resistance